MKSVVSFLLTARRLSAVGFVSVLVVLSGCDTEPIAEESFHLLGTWELSAIQWTNMRAGEPNPISEPDYQESIEFLSDNTFVKVRGSLTDVGVYEVTEDDLGLIVKLTFEDGARLNYSRSSVVWLSHRSGAALRESYMAFDGPTYVYDKRSFPTPAVR